jgi:hypothetical protein
MTAQLSIVNHALGDMYQDGAPQFTFIQLMDMFASPNYAGYMKSHFFILDNPSNITEVDNVCEAYNNWLQGIVESVNAMPDSDLEAVLSLNSNNKFHSDRVRKLATDSDDENVENLLSDSDEDDDVNVTADTQRTAAFTQRVRFSGEVNFKKTARFNEVQRKELLMTVCRLFKPIKFLNSIIFQTD